MSPQYIFGTYAKTQKCGCVGFVGSTGTKVYNDFFQIKCCKSQTVFITELSYTIRPTFY